MPISYASAQPILAHLGGAAAPASWQGGLAADVPLGDGSVVHMNLDIAYQTSRCTTSPRPSRARRYPNEIVRVGGASRRVDVRQRRQPVRRRVGAADRTRAGQAARDRLAAGPHDPDRHVGRRGVRPVRFDRIRRGPGRQQARARRRVPQHGHRRRPGLRRVVRAVDGRPDPRRREAGAVAGDERHGVRRLGQEHRRIGADTGAAWAAVRTTPPSSITSVFPPRTSARPHRAATTTAAATTSTWRITTSIRAGSSTSRSRRSSGWPSCGWPTPTSCRCTTSRTRTRSAST